MIETLKNVRAVNGFSVVDILSEEQGYIYVSHKTNELIVKIQDGPIKENGVNGVQVDEIIAVAKSMLEGLNKNIPCDENRMAIGNLDACLVWLKKRKKDRESRGVEGTSEE